MQDRSRNSGMPLREEEETLVIRARGVTKRFGDFAAIQELDLDVRAGECVGLLGPNGAGKSTFIGCLYGVVLRSGGASKSLATIPRSIRAAIKQRVGVVPQENALDEELTVSKTCSSMRVSKASQSTPRFRASTNCSRTCRWSISATRRSERFQEA